MWKIELQPRRFGLGYCMGHAPVVQWGKGEIKAVDECVGGLKLWNSLCFYVKCWSGCEPLQKALIQGLRAPLKHNICQDSKPDWWSGVLWQHRALCKYKKVLPWIFHQKKRTHSRWRKTLNYCPKAETMGEVMKWQPLKYKYSSPFLDCPNEIHTIQIFLIGKIQCENRTQSTSFRVPEISQKE